MLETLKAVLSSAGKHRGSAAAGEGARGAVGNLGRVAAGRPVEGPQPYQFIRAPRGLHSMKEINNGEETLYGAARTHC